MKRFADHQSRRQFLAAGAAGLTLLRPAAAVDPRPVFEEIPPETSGIRWAHDNAASPEHYLPETMGPGCAFLDYDNDGWMDIYLVNSGPCDFYKPGKADPQRALQEQSRRHFHRCDRSGRRARRHFRHGRGRRRLRQRRLSRPLRHRLRAPHSLSQQRKRHLHRCQRKGRPRRKVFEGHWTTSAVWFDFDNDGRLDLFVCSFVDYGTESQLSCGDNKLGRKFYCIPRVFKPTANLLFHNNGDGTFTEVSRGTDIAKALGKGLGVVATDINNDGRMDLFVANDTVQNFLFVNRGPDAKGQTQWEEIALAAEVGFSEDGRARSGMGVDAADFDGDGWQDLFVANVDQEMFSLYKNSRNETFRDVAFKNQISQATRLLSGWGLRFFDYDNDGTLDLFLANGHPDDMIDNYSQAVKYKEPLLLFHQENGQLRNVSAESGPVFAKSFAARGLAIGDFNNDGRIDVLVGNNGGPPLLLRNNAGAGNHWLGVKLQGTKCNRDAVGARLTWSAGGVKRSRLKNNGGSYLSSHDMREVLGIGTAAKLDWLEIQWPQPSGRTERLTDLPVDRYITITEGKGVS